MFNCYTHGWTSPVYVCRECFPLKLTTSTSTTHIYTEELVGISSSELNKLKKEIVELERQLSNHKQLLSDICQEWNEDCDSDCDSVTHTETCKSSNIAEAKKELKERAELAEANVKQLCDVLRACEEGLISYFGEQDSPLLIKIRVVLAEIEK